MGGGTFGVDGAAHFYFNKSARDVNLAEAAMLAGLFKAPTKYAPHVNLPAARARANVVLRQSGRRRLHDRRPGVRRAAQSGDRGRSQRRAIRRITISTGRSTRCASWSITFRNPRRARASSSAPRSTGRAARRGRADRKPVPRSSAATTTSTQAATVVADLDGGVRAMVGGRDYGDSQFNRAVDATASPARRSSPMSTRPH